MDDNKTYVAELAGAADDAAGQAAAAHAAASIAQSALSDALAKFNADPENNDLKTALSMAQGDLKAKSDVAQQAQSSADSARKAADDAKAAADAKAASASSTAPTATTPVMTTPQAYASYLDMLRAVALDTTLQAADKKEILRALKPTNPASDRMTYRVAISLLGAVAILTILAMAILYGLGWDITQPVASIATAAVAGLTGVLASSRSTSDPH